MVVAVAKALGAAPVILTDIRDDRLAIGTHMGADVVINASQVSAVDAVRRANGGRGVDYVFECSGAPNAVNDAVRMVSRGGRVCSVRFHISPPSWTSVTSSRTTSIYGIRGEGKSAVRRAASLTAQRKIDASPVHTHTFALDELPTGLRYARDRIDGAIKVVIKPQVVRGGTVDKPVHAFAES